MAAALGMAPRTLQRCCRWLERRGWLLLTEPGSCPEYPHSAYRRRALDAGSTNLARAWLLQIPAGAAVTESGRSGAPWHPATPEKPSAQAREALTGPAPDELDRRFAPDSSPPPSPGTEPVQAPAWPLGQKPGQRRRSQLAACESLRARHMVLRRLSARGLRSILRPWFRAGWTPADVLSALEYEPSGRPHSYAAGVRVPDRWLTGRLAWWLGPGAEPLPSPGQLRDVAAGQRQAEEAAQRAAGVLAPRVAPVPDPEPRPDDRAQLRAGSGSLAARGAALARELMNRRNA